jgi:biotin carboxyl carrier protein
MIQWHQGNLQRTARMKKTMSFMATVQKQTYRVETEENGQQQHITLDGTAYAIDWRQIAPLAGDAQGRVGQGGRYSLLLAGKSYDILVRRITRSDQKDSQTYEIFIAGQRFEVKVEDERERLLAGLVQTSAHSGEMTVQAPMPGLVVGVPVEQGATVQAGQTVAVLEAMKMENDLSAPLDGVVKEIRVKQGQTVDQGEVLVVIVGEEA